MTPDTSGPTLPEPLAYYDPGSCSWRMSGGMFPSDSMPSLATLPTWGMTRRGALYELPTPALPTPERASSSLLPTPCSQEPGGTAEAHLERKNRIDGANRVTPTHLAFITALLPTPAVNDMGRAYTPEEWDTRTAKMQAAHGNGNGHGKSLEIEAQRLLPTPTVDDAGNLTRDSGQFQSLTRAAVSLLPTPGVAGGGKKVPEDAVWSGKAAYKPDGTKVQVHIDRIADLLHGGTTPPLSTVGSTSSDEQLPGQLSLDESESA